MQITLKSQNKPDTSEFWLENKLLIKFNYHISSLLHWLSLNKSLVHLLFIYILYAECNEDVRGNIVLQNNQLEIKNVSRNFRD